MSRKKETCLCPNGTPCGYVEVIPKHTAALRAFGAVVKRGLDNVLDKRGLDNVLDGYWVRSCWRDAYDAYNRLGGEHEYILTTGDLPKHAKTFWGIGATTNSRLRNEYLRKHFVFGHRRPPAGIKRRTGPDALVWGAMCKACKRGCEAANVTTAVEILLRDPTECLNCASKSAAEMYHSTSPNP